MELDTLAGLKEIVEASKEANIGLDSMKLGKALYERMKGRGVPPRDALAIVARSDIETSAFDPDDKLWQQVVNAVADHHTNIYNALLEIWGPVDVRVFVDTIRFSLEIP